MRNRIFHDHLWICNLYAVHASNGFFQTYSLMKVRWNDIDKHVQVPCDLFWKGRSVNPWFSAVSSISKITTRFATVSNCHEHCPVSVARMGNAHGRRRSSILLCKEGHQCASSRTRAQRHTRNWISRMYFPLPTLQQTQLYPRRGHNLHIGQSIAACDSTATYVWELADL
jgi:hypothetical protein